MEQFFAVVQAVMLIFWPVWGWRMSKSVRYSLRERKSMVQAAVGFEVGGVVVLSSFFAGGLLVAIAGMVIYAVTLFSLPSRDTTTRPVNEMAPAVGASSGFDKIIDSREDDPNGSEPFDDGELK